MARPIQPYIDFSGGLNSQSANEKLKDNECPVLENVDLSSRASLKRRTGRALLASQAGTGQGMFFYYRDGQTQPDILVAINGRLYVMSGGVLTEILITDNGAPFTFQPTLPIEAVQYREDLFIATGTKLVELTYDGGWVAKTVSPYKPVTLEAINIGLNALASDPSSWIQGKEESSVSIEGIIPSIAEGAANTPIRFAAHVKKPANVDVNYSFSWRKTGSGAFSYVKQNSPDNFADITFDDIGGYDIKAETKKVTYPIEESFNNTQTYPGMIKGNEWDSAGGSGCLILNGSSYIDLPQALDMSKGDTLEWWWTVYSSDTASGLNNNSVQLKFYAEGDLTTPVLTVGNVGGQGRGIGGGWTKQVSTYDNSVVGLDKIVRVGFGGGKVAVSGTYVAGSGSWTIDPSDTTSRFDDIVFYKSGTESSYTLSDYQVVGVIDPSKDPDSYKEIHTSRMIRLHWDRILLGKDSKYPGQLYISDLNNPRYFPTNKRIDFSLDRHEPITAVVRFQDFLVIFTKTTISTLTGKGPQDGEIVLSDTYQVSLINDQIGCIADRSAKVVGNQILFLSSEGLHSLTPNPYTMTNMNVARIDQAIQDEVPIQSDAAALVYDNQYWLAFPSESVLYRFYYEQGIWAKDTSSKLNITQFLRYEDDIYNLTTLGGIMQHDETLYADDGEAYEMSVETKEFNLSDVFRWKKVKRFLLVAKHYESHEVELFVTIKADQKIILEPDRGEAVVNPDGTVTWQSTTDPNFSLETGTVFGAWVMGESTFGQKEMSIQLAKVKHGRCKRVKIAFKHKQAAPCEIFGFGLEYKPKSKA